MTIAFEWSPVAGSREPDCGTGTRTTVIVRAQALLAGEAAAALAGHEAIWAWDLGNENSNCVRPPSRSSARDWLRRMVSAIRTSDQRAIVTVGLHMEDLEEDRKLGPQQAAEEGDFLSMHGYPSYTPWADGPTDEQLAALPRPCGPLARRRQ